MIKAISIDTSPTGRWQDGRFAISREDKKQARIANPQGRGKLRTVWNPGGGSSDVDFKVTDNGLGADRTGPRAPCFGRNRRARRAVAESRIVAKSDLSRHERSRSNIGHHHLGTVNRILA